jgi:hypothetical protein
VKWAGRRLIVSSLALCAAALSNAQTSTNPSGQSSAANTPIKHVIMIIQENRSTDNMFGADTTLAQNGGHLAASGSSNRVGLLLRLTSLPHRVEDDVRPRQNGRSL